MDNPMTDPGNAYRESAARGASAVGQVVLLYGQIVNDLRKAIEAIERNRIDERTNSINHAMVVVGYLQSTLNFEVGGEVAPNLERFYDLLRRKLVEAQFESSKEILNEQIALLLDLREAWVEVDRATSSPPAFRREAASATPEGSPSSGGWNA